MSETILSYKGFDKDLKCRDFQYEIGKEYQHDGEVSVCNGGFHACEVPMDVFGYYAPCDSRFCQVEQSGALSRSGEDSKVASEKIKIGAEIGVPGFVKAQIEWVKNICKDAPEQIAQGDRGHAAAQGACGRAAVKGRDAIAAAFGVDGAAQAALGSWIMCAEWERTDAWHIKDVKTARVDGEIIKADTWYQLKNGEFVEVVE